MKKLINKLLLVGVCLLILMIQATTTNAQIRFKDPNTIITSVPFLRIVPEARAGGMGDVGIATSPDANSMHFNASKLVFAEQDLSISATYTPWLRALNLQDVYLAYLSGYNKLSDLESIGFSLRYFSLGNIQFTDENGMPLQSARPNEYEIAGAYSRKLTDNFSGGVALKFIYSRLAVGNINGQDIRPGIAAAGDISFTYQDDVKVSGNNSILRVGGAISNLGTRIAYTDSEERDFIPTNLGLGAALEIEIDDYNTIGFALDVNKLLVPTPDTIDLDGDGILDYKQIGTVDGIFSSFGDAPGGFSEEISEVQLSAGIEYWYDKQFAIRTGYFYESNIKGNRQFFTVGIGLKYNIFGMNISYLVPTNNQVNPLNNTLRFSLIFDFAAFAEDGTN